MQNKGEKVIIVTGGTGALGKVLVRVLAKQNFRIYLPVLNIQKFSKIFYNDGEGKMQELRKIYSMECDGTNEQQVKKFVSDVATLENGKINVLINLIGGIHPPCNIVDMANEFFDKYFKLNFLTAFYFSHCVLKYMAENREGIILSIGAKAGLKEEPGRFAYSIGKLAVIHLMNTISKEMEDYNIRCNTIVPSIIDTEENRKWAKGDEYKKLVSPLEIAEVISDLILNKYSRVKESIIKIY